MVKKAMKRTVFKNLFSGIENASNFTSKDVNLIRDVLGLSEQTHVVLS